MTAQPQTAYDRLSDLELAACVIARDAAAVRLVTERNNQRLYRAAWSILRNRAEAEEVVQEAYLKGFSALAGFNGAASLSTWLTRIAINEALQRLRAERRRRAQLDAGSVVAIEDYRDKLMQGSAGLSTPGQALARQQLRQVMEEAIARLPSPFRLTFVLREIEGLSGEEAAAALGVPEATVKTRLHRARKLLREALGTEIRSVLTGAFPFAGADCARLSEAVLARYCGAPAQPQGDHRHD